MAHRQPNKVGCIEHEENPNVNTHSIRKQCEIVFLNILHHVQSSLKSATYSLFLNLTSCNFFCWVCYREGAYFEFLKYGIKVSALIQCENLIYPIQKFKPLGGEVLPLH